MDEGKELTYLCVFAKGICPVRTQYKLQPENLLEYCKICYINPTNKQEPKRDVTMLSDLIPQLLEMYLRMEKGEREPFLKAIKTLSDIQTH